MASTAPVDESTQPRDAVEVSTKKSPSRSPSPAPAPPLASAPGPRAQALEKIFHDALDASLKKCSYANFADCFPTMAQYVPESLDGLWRDFLSGLGGSTRENFDLILEKRNVVSSLNALDTLLNDARKRKARAEADASSNREKSADPSTPLTPPVPPHTLSPETLYHSHLHPFLTSHAASLNSETEAVQAGNTAIFEDIKAQREEIASLVHGLEDVVKELEKAAQMVEGEVLGGLDEEMRSIEGGLKS